MLSFHPSFYFKVTLPHTLTFHPPQVQKFLGQQKEQIFFGINEVLDVKLFLSYL